METLIVGMRRRLCGRELEDRKVGCDNGVLGSGEVLQSVGRYEVESSGMWYSGWI